MQLAPRAIWLGVEAGCKNTVRVMVIPLIAYLRPAASGS
jgi:hypothetical protein